LNDPTLKLAAAQDMLLALASTDMDRTCNGPKEKMQHAHASAAAKYGEKRISEDIAKAMVV
jgi:hydrogenase maturation factor HypF (carbamoyltransferase family)